MTNLYFIKHGLTLWDCFPIRVQGQKDVPLSQKGIQQAKILANFLSTINFSKLYTSPLKRTKKTAEIINEKLKLEVIEDERLKEAHRGLWEGKILKKILQQDVKNFNHFQKNPATFIFPEGESIINLQKRMLTFCEEIILKNKGKNILIITHGGHLRALLCQVLGKGLDYFHNFKIDNASITLLNYKNNSFKLVEINKVISQIDLGN